MALLQQSTPQLLLAAYRYQGSRPIGPRGDRFDREAAAANAYAGKAEIDLLAQQGRDSSATGYDGELRSSGGYEQFRWAFSHRLTAVARFDCIADDRTSPASTLTTSLVFGLRPNMKLTLETVFGHGRSVLNAAYLVAY